MELAGNTVLITGGSSGIGLALAEQWFNAGSEVIICGRHEDRLLKAKKQLPRLHTLVCDVSDLAECRRLASCMTNEFPAVNILVNNAGIQRDIDFTHGIDALLAGESEIRTNLESTIHLSALFAPILSGKPGAAVINISSGLGFVPMARMPVYCATKAAIHAFSLALRHQIHPLGIRLIEVIPPAVETNLNPEGRAQRGSYHSDVTAAEFATAVMAGLAADLDEIAYGSSTGLLEASRAELRQRFRSMNG